VHDDGSAWQLVHGSGFGFGPGLQLMTALIASGNRMLLLLLQVVFEAAAPVGDTKAYDESAQQLFPHLVRHL
jgi:hypothetical protein